MPNERIYEQIRTYHIIAYSNLEYIFSIQFWRLLPDIRVTGLNRCYDAY